MFKPIEVFIGLRYTRAKRRNHFISFISMISMGGIALGITALIVVLSVMNGFHTEVRERILGMASHVTVEAARGELKDWRDVESLVKSHPEVVGRAPYVEGQAMLINGRNVSGALLRGVLPLEEGQVADVGEHMKVGSLDNLVAGEFGVVLGAELAYVLGARAGDAITVVTPQASVTPAGVLPRLKRFRVVGVFEVGMGEYDRGVALMHLEDAAKLFNLKEGVSGVRVKLNDLYDAPEVSRELTAELDAHSWASYRVRNWTQVHRNFFSALQTEKRIMSIILFLIVAVAAFNIVSTLVMVVTDKESDIAILRTLGASPRSIMWIFIIQGATIGFVGTLFGLIAGVALALNVEDLVAFIESKFGVDFLDANIYYISELPSELRWGDAGLIAATAFLLTLLATLYPAWRASRTQPAEALRYE